MWCHPGARQEFRGQSDQKGSGGVTRIFRVKSWALAALTTQTQLLVFNMATTDSNTDNRERQRKGEQ